MGLLFSALINFRDGLCWPHEDERQKPDGNTGIEYVVSQGQRGSPNEWWLLRVVHRE
jgi:hypothetical protein